MRGRKPKPSALRRFEGNPSKRGFNHAEPLPPDGMPDCPDHLNEVAQIEWDRIARSLYDMGVLTLVDRAALAAYCQAYGRWVEAEEKLRTTPTLLKTPSGYVQQSPWLGIANKQMELMGRYMSELGITPASRSRVVNLLPEPAPETFVFKVIYEDRDGTQRDQAGQIVAQKTGDVLLDGNL